MSLPKWESSNNVCTFVFQNNNATEKWPEELTPSACLYLGCPTHTTCRGVQSLEEWFLKPTQWTKNSYANAWSMLDYVRVRFSLNTRQSTNMVAKTNKHGGGQTLKVPREVCTFSLLIFQLVIGEPRQGIPHPLGDSMLSGTLIFCKGIGLKSLSLEWEL